MSRKEIQRNRTRKYFIEACEQIIASDGLEGVTLRKVADLAGYNSATLYNYFDSLEHLLLYTSFKKLGPYLQKLKELPPNSDGLAYFLSVWRVFAEEAFQQPLEYYRMFFEFSGEYMAEALSTYYALYPEVLEGVGDELRPMLERASLWNRNLALLKQCMPTKLVEADMVAMNDILILVFQGMLLRVKNGEQGEDSVQALINCYDHVLVGYNCRSRCDHSCEISIH